MRLGFISLLLIFIAQFGCEQKAAVTISTDGWKIVEKDNFSLALPTSMVEHKVPGIDTLVYRFEDSNLALDIEYGGQAFNYFSRDRVKDLKESSVEISGRMAKLTSFTRIEDEQQERTSVLFFRNINESEFNLVIWARYKSDVEKEIAFSIFNTVKLKS